MAAVGSASGGIVYMCAYVCCLIHVHFFTQLPHTYIHVHFNVLRSESSVAVVVARCKLGGDGAHGVVVVAVAWVERQQQNRAGG